MIRKESMILTTTFRRLRSANACGSRLKFLRESLKGVKDNGGEGLRAHDERGHRQPHHAERDFRDSA
jgi:hypothetical protein